MPPSLLTTLRSRDELEAAQAANEKYNPLKVLIAILGVLAVIMFFFAIAWFAWQRRRRQKEEALEQQTAKDVAMVELFGGSQHVKGLKDEDFEDVDLRDQERRKKGVTRWSFAKQIGK